jgi:NAD(P)H-dependent FMN reductase
MMADTNRHPDAASLRLALIYGSTRAGRFCDTIAAWARAEIARHGGFTVDIIDPAQAASDQFAAALDAADAYLVLVPEYNHGYPAPLKALVDSYYDEWQAKPVAFVSYGGVSGGIRAVEQLRQVFAELHAVTVRDAVSFADAAAQFDDDGHLRSPARAQRSARTMLTRLHWWATVLREARRTRPYAATSVE